MNERIKEIAKECGFDTKSMYPGGFPNEQTLALHLFAEKIIEECIEQVYPVSLNKGIPRPQTPLGLAVTRVKDHFGLKD
jgi:AraC-like DNA-binding protein